MKRFKVGKGLALGIALGAGLLLTIQVGFNSTVGQKLGSPLAGSYSSFAGGLLTLIIVNASQLLGRSDWRGLKRMPWWAYLSGVSGLFYIITTIIVAPAVGLAPMTATIVAGQMLGSLVVDKLGALGFEKKQIGFWQWLGAGLLPVATALVLGVADGNSFLKEGGNYWLLLLSSVAGLTLSVSAGLNATVGVYVKSPAGAALYNFCSGVVVLILFSVVAFSAGFFTIDWANLGANMAATPGWAWFGGVLGATYVTGVTIAAPSIGAAMTNVLLVSGQLFMSLVADTVGLFRAEGHPLTPFRVAGVVLLVLVVLLIKSARPVQSRFSPKSAVKVS